jgi:hypothetical protein
MITLEDRKASVAQDREAELEEVARINATTNEGASTMTTLAHRKFSTANRRKTQPKQVARVHQSETEMMPTGMRQHAALTKAQSSNDRDTNHYVIPEGRIMGDVGLVTHSTTEESRPMTAVMNNEAPAASAIQQPNTGSASVMPDGGANMEPRIDAFLYQLFVRYARDLREKYAGQKIRNAAVVQSALREFFRRGLITLVKAEEGIPGWFPTVKVKCAKAKNGQPIWMPTKKLVQDWLEICDALSPALCGDSLCWSVRPGKKTL